MHVLERLAAAIADRIKADCPDFEERVFTNGAAGWDRRSYPMCLVAIGDSRIDRQNTGTGARTGRLQVRTVELIVEVAATAVGTAPDRSDAPRLLVQQLSDLIAQVETALDGFDDVPVDDLDLAEITGIEGVERRDEQHLRATQAITYAAIIHTVEGRPDAFAEELY